MQVYLRDRKESLCNEWREIFKDCPDVHISRGDIFEEGEHLNVDAIVSPANSMGFMCGGIDYVYSEYFGWGIGDTLRTILWQEYFGELLVGQAVVVDIKLTNPKTRIPYLISAPTMRVPMNVANTVNAYLAFSAALRVAKKNNIKSILCPGLGTAVGEMQSDVCAVQMYEAYKTYDKPRFYDVLGVAHKKHYAMLNADTYKGAFRG